MSTALNVLARWLGAGRAGSRRLIIERLADGRYAATLTSETTCGGESPADALAQICTVLNLTGDASS